jgi:hypothetical protein
MAFWMPYWPAAARVLLQAPRVAGLRLLIRAADYFREQQCARGTSTCPHLDHFYIVLAAASRDASPLTAGQSSARKLGGVNQQAAAKGHPPFDLDAWREHVRLAALARSDQNTQRRLNSTPIGERRPWWWRRWPAERTRIPFRTPIADLQTKASARSPTALPPASLKARMLQFRQLVRMAAVTRSFDSAS